MPPSRSRYEVSPRCPSLTLSSSRHWSCRRRLPPLTLCPWRRPLLGSRTAWRRVLPERSKLGCPVRSTIPGPTWTTWARRKLGMRRGEETLWMSTRIKATGTSSSLLQLLSSQQRRRCQKRREGRRSNSEAPAARSAFLSVRLCLLARQSLILSRHGRIGQLGPWRGLEQASGGTQDCQEAHSSSGRAHRRQGASTRTSSHHHSHGLFYTCAFRSSTCREACSGCPSNSCGHTLAHPFRARTRFSTRIFRSFVEPYIARVLSCTRIRIIAGGGRPRGRIDQGGEDEATPGGAAEADGQGETERRVAI